MPPCHGQARPHVETVLHVGSLHVAPSPDWPVQLDRRSRVDVPWCVRRWFVAACVKVPARACTLASAHVLHAVPVACCSLCADVPKPEMPKVGGTLHAAVEAAVPSEILPLQPMLAQEFTMSIIRLIPCPFINQCARQAGHGLWELNPGATCGGIMQLCCACTASLAACHLCVGPLVAGVATCRAALRQQQQESSSHKSTGPCVW